MNELSAERANKIRETVIQWMDLFIDHLIETALDKDGLVAGQMKLSREDRIMKVMDLAQRGVLQELANLAPNHFEDIVKQFEKDMEDFGAAVP